jgi:FKBP-type peptidyl-prolyl cis-trans isomerase
MFNRGMPAVRTAALLVSVSLLALSACSKKEASEENLAEVPSVEEVAGSVAEDALKRSETFLAKNAKRKGVLVQDSGLQFESVKAGDGPVANGTDYVTVHYTGTLSDGTVFDSSVDNGGPITFELNRVIPGWREGIQLMKQGETAKFYLPPELGYGEQGAGAKIGPNEALVFEVELLEVIAADNKERIQEVQQEAYARQLAAFNKLASDNAAAAVAFLEENATKEGIQTTESGLQYQVISEGAGDISPNATDKVEVHYRGTLLDGTEFDSSYRGGKTIEFRLDGVIPGWTEGVQLMNVGDKYRFFLPPELGYGENGTGPGGPIGPNELLIFEVELVDVK